MNRGRNTRYNGLRRKSMWIPLGALVALAILFILIGGTLIYASSRRKNQQKAEKKEYAQVRDIPSADLIYTVIPKGTSHQDKEYTGFTVCFNRDNGTANWVGWELTADKVKGTVPRAKNFWCDTDIDGCPTTDDYRRSGYDRGHLFPAADAKWSADAMQECFSLANITPQDNKLNGGAWKKLEDRERTWASKFGRVIIVSGPIYQKGDTKRIGDTGVRVPSAFFKVILAPDLEEPSCMGFIYNNSLCPGRMENYQMSVDQVEEITGFDFFSALPDEVENRIEAMANITMWNRSLQ